MNNNSEVIKLFLQIQAKTGGDLAWADLNPLQQIQFTDCVRFIVNVTSARKCE